MILISFRYFSQGLNAPTLGSTLAAGLPDLVPPGISLVNPVQVSAAPTVEVLEPIAPIEPASGGGGLRFEISSFFSFFYLNSHFFFSFSAGAIAGIVIGATAGALLLVGVAVAAATKMNRSDSSSSSGVAKQRKNKGVPVMNPESAARRVEEHEMTRFVSSFPCLPALLPRYLPFFTLFPFLQCDWKEQVLKHQNKPYNFSFTLLNKCGLTKFSNCFNNIFFYLP